MVFMLAACQEVTLQTAPEAIVRANECPEPQHTSGESESGAWGTVDGINQGVSWDINAGYTVVICVRTQNETGQLTLTGQGSQTWNGFNHWSLIGISGGGSTLPTPTTEPTPTTTEATTITTTAGEDTTTTGGETTSTFAPAEVTTTEAGGVTTTAAGVTTTAASGETTTADGGGTLDPGQVTTTAVVGGGTLEPGQVTSTTGPGTTGDSGEETTTSGDEVAGGSEGSLPYTGVGDMTMGGMAGLLVAAGILILLLFRGKSDSE
jgi:hypothetical protein